MAEDKDILSLRESDEGSDPDGCSTSEPGADAEFLGNVRRKQSRQEKELKAQKERQDDQMSKLPEMKESCRQRNHENRTITGGADLTLDGLGIAIYSPVGKLSPPGDSIFGSPM